MQSAVVKRPTLTSLQVSFWFCVLIHSGREVPVDPEFQSWASQHLSGGTQCGHRACLCGVCCCCSCVIPAVTHVPAVTHRAQANAGCTAVGAVSSAPCSALLGAGVSCGRPVPAPPSPHLGPWSHISGRA